MKWTVLHIILFFCITQMLQSQENGVVAFDIPARNSLKFNRYVINPTFSFVRESNKYISFNNKRQWTQFDDNPETYLFSFSGRFKENMGLGVGLFQQNYGVMTTFGGIVNYAYNISTSQESNLTFGLNAAFYQSKINDGNVITNFPDPSLQNIENNSLITINPGINFGTGLFDFGLSVNNAVLYNLNTSEMIEDNPEQSFQAHAMYTGFMNSNGFFDQSKFTTLITSEFKKETTVVSGLLMLMVPKGIWGQAGYNSLYGVTGGLGINITQQIAIEYNFEKSVGELSNFGSSHDITLAYKFKNNERYDYSEEEEETALLSSSNFKKKRPARTKAKAITAEAKKAAELRRATIKAERIAKAAEQDSISKANAVDKENAKIKLAEEQELAKVKAAEDAKLKAEQDAKDEIKRQEDEKRRAIEATKLAEERAKLAELAQIKAAAEKKAQAEAKLIADAQEKERLRLREIARKSAEEKAKEQAEIDAIKAAELAEQQKILDEQREIERLEREAEELAEIEAKAKADKEAQELAKKEALEQAIKNDPTAKALDDLKKITEQSDSVQENLLNQLEEKVSIKRQDLNDLKEENDLGEQGIYVEPKPFKSLTAENNVMKALKSQIDDNIKTQSQRLEQLEQLYAQRLKKVPSRLDELNLKYQTEISQLKMNQLQAVQAKERLDANLSQIEAATEIERKRRIKRAAYDNETDRYNKDRAALKVLIETTPLSAEPLESEDFNFGETRSDIQILKNVGNVESGYYMVIATHTDVAKRDEFLSKAIASGRRDINFFYDVNTSKYYIYYEKFNEIRNAETALKQKGNRPYNGNMSMVKIEN